MTPFNKDQQRSFIERTCTLASEKGWKRLFGEIGDLERPRVWPLVLLQVQHILCACPTQDCWADVPSHLHDAGSERQSDGSARPANDEVLKLDCVGFSFARTPVFA